jgi:hypothetical protein
VGYRIPATSDDFAGFLEVEICLPVMRFDDGLRHQRGF